jgi:hypothetical protein
MRRVRLLPALLIFASTAIVSFEALAQRCNRCGGCRSSGRCHGTVAAPEETADAAADSTVTDAEEAAPSEEYFTGATESFVNAPLTFAPGTLGDFFGGTGQIVLDPAYQSQYGGDGVISPPIAGGDRRFKIADNNSPMPRDRFFFNYHHFENALSGPNDQTPSLDRFVFGAEKTFFCEQTSLELRVPFARGLDAAQVSNDTLVGTEFGDIGLAAKGILYRDCRNVLSVGLGMTLPTAQDASVTHFGNRVLVIDNSAVHLQPFIGYLRTPTPRLFTQLFAQLDFDANGNRILDGGGQVDGRFQDQNLFYLDWSTGYWLHQDSCARFLQGIAGMVELHYTTTLNDADAVTVTSPITFFRVDEITNPFNRMDVLNLTGGLHLQIGQCSTLRVGAVVPLKDEEEKLFDAEMFVQFNRRF